MLFVELERIYITRKTGKNGNVNFIRQWQIDRVCAICHKQILWRLKKLQAIYLYLNIKMDNKINQGHFIEFFLFFYYFYYYYIDNAWQIIYLNLIPFFSDKTNYILCHKMQFFKSWKEIYTTVLRINHKTFKDFIDEQKFSLINISLKENFLLEEVKVIFFSFLFWKYIATRMKRYFNDGEQWKRKNCYRRRIYIKSWETNASINFS